MELNFLERLKNYDKNNISDNILKKLRELIQKKLNSILQLLELKMPLQKVYVFGVEP